MAVVKNRFIRNCIFVFGVLFVLLGILGAFLPVLPTTPFILLAAWCFLRSSEKAHKWIYQQPVFGEALKNWEENRSISRRIKMLAIFTITLSLLFIWMRVSHLWVKCLVTVLLTLVSLFISAQNER